MPAAANKPSHLSESVNEFLRLSAGNKLNEFLIL